MSLVGTIPDGAVCGYDCCRRSARRITTAPQYIRLQLSTARYCRSADRPAQVRSRRAFQELAKQHRNITAGQHAPDDGLIQHNHLASSFRFLKNTSPIFDFGIGAHHDDLTLNNTDAYLPLPTAPTFSVDTRRPQPHKVADAAVRTR